MRLSNRQMVSVFAAVMLVVVGSVVFWAGSVYAQGNDLDPGSVLEGDELDVWNELTQEYQDIFTDDVLPKIKAEVVGHGARVDAVGGTVRALRDIQDQDSRHSSDYTASGRVRCYLGVGISSTSAYSILRCMATMAKIRTKVRVSQQYGPAIDQHSSSCWDCSLGMTFVGWLEPLSRDRVWIADGWGFPTGYRNGPHPDRHKYYGRACLPVRCRL